MHWFSIIEPNVKDTPSRKHTLAAVQPERMILAEADGETMEESKSKSQIKREMKALQSLGEKLVELRPEQLAALPLEEVLREAIVIAQKIHAHGGRKRQIKYIGKLLRNCDSATILQTLDNWRERERQAAASFHRIEHWRDRLIEEGDAALEVLLGEYPDANRQRIRLLVRNARREKERNRPPNSARTLFRYLRDLLEE